MKFLWHKNNLNKQFLVADTALKLEVQYRLQNSLKYTTGNIKQEFLIQQFQELHTK